MTEPHRAVIARLSADFASISRQLARVSADLTELDRVLTGRPPVAQPVAASYWPQYPPQYAYPPPPPPPPVVPANPRPERSEALDFVYASGLRPRSGVAG